MAEEKNNNSAAKQELARLIFTASNLSDIQGLRRHLDRHPHLWLTLSTPVKNSVENLVYEADQVECLVNGPGNFAFRY